jgi:RsiW-degrading membrane proteinase PrsW (M82 family)
MFLIGFFGAIPVLVAELAVGVLAVGVFGKRTMSEDGSGDSADSGGGSVSALTVLGIFINSFLVAGLCEEGLKFVLATVYRRLRPELRSFRAILFYGTLGPLGFAASENLLYLVSNGLTNKDVSSGLTLSVMRVLIPLHPMTGYLITLGVIERDFFNQPQLKWLRICAWPIFFHGLFDFGIFLMSAFIDGNQREGETSEDASWRVLVYLIAFVLAVLAGLATVIVLTYRRLFHRQGFQPLQPVV